MSIEDLKHENNELKTENLELQSQLTLMQTIFDSLSEGVVATNLEGEFLIANPSAQNMVGTAPVEGTLKNGVKLTGRFIPIKLPCILQLNSHSTKPCRVRQLTMLSWCFATRAGRRVFLSVSVGDRSTTKPGS